MATLLIAIAAAPSSSSSPPPAPQLHATYEVIAERHISDLMTVFLSDELTSEWTPTLDFMRQVHTRDMGDLSHQQFNLPWPLAPRDVLLTCDRKIIARDALVTSECHSVEHPSVPTDKGAVRLTLDSTSWRLEALSGERTKLTLTLRMPAAMTVGVPTWIVKHVQKSSLKDSVSQLLAAVDRLQLPAHSSFLGWRRTRAEARVASAAVAAASPGLHAWALGSFGATTAVLALLAVVLAHCVTFACLAKFWQQRKSDGKSGGKSSGAIGTSPSEACPAAGDAALGLIVGSKNAGRSAPGLRLRLYGGLAM